jgi:hypothetical protein
VRQIRPGSTPGTFGISSIAIFMKKLCFAVCFGIIGCIMWIQTRAMSASGFTGSGRGREAGV